MNIDYKKHYSDEFYENFINDFKPNTKSKLFFRFVKRLVDIICSLLCIILLSPIMLIVALMVKITSKGPIIFKQQRMGRNCKTFNCYKFRSMKIDSPHDMATSLIDDPNKLYTPIGKFIRKLSIDEFPQFFNILFGHMSFIGPRPVVLTENNLNEMRRRLNVYSMRPGISGYAQVHGRDDVYYKNKAIMDAYYVKNASLWLDLKLIFQTVGVLFLKKGNNS